MKPNLDVCITTWNSATFIGAALEGVRAACSRWKPRILVWDNVSDDASVSIARAHGAEVHIGRCSQGDALNRLVARSRADLVLLMHADVVLLDAHAFDRCCERLVGNIVLVSPEDIGCGPWTRPFGRGMPESSFLLFRRDGLEALRKWQLGPRRFGVRLPRSAVDFYGPHVTHRLPEALLSHGMTWYPLKVHASPMEASAWYVPDWEPPVWRADLGSLRYGLGNFYSIDGRVSHYHNWYDRALMPSDTRPRSTIEGSGQGVPFDYVSRASLRFLEDWRGDCLRLPEDLDWQPKPVSL